MSKPWWQGLQDKDQTREQQEQEQQAAQGEAPDADPAQVAGGNARPPGSVLPSRVAAQVVAHHWPKRRAESLTGC